MTSHDVTTVAERVVRAALGPNVIDAVIVREDDDWSGDPSLFVDIFLQPEAWPVAGEASLSFRHELSRELRAAGERRFAYVRLRDREGEQEDEDCNPRHVS